MEGVVVSAKKDGSTITVSVVTDAQGRFAFPAARLEPGRYTLKARAAGYELDGARAADVAAGQEAKADIRLKKVKNLSAHLTNAEWMIEHAGHGRAEALPAQLQRLPHARAHHEVDVRRRRLLAGLPAHGLYYPGSTPLKPQRLAGTATRDVERGGDGRKTAEWLASVNLSQQQTWSFPLKTQPRLTGKSTRVIITEYDLPNPLIQPHDVVLDREGNVWYSDFGQMFLGKMDPKTGKVTQYPIPVVKPGWPEGTLDLEFDKDDNPWVGVMYQSAIAKFDKKTEKFQMWQTPKEWDTDAGQLGHLAVEGTHVDNKVWIKNSDVGNIYRLDLDLQQDGEPRRLQGSAAPASASAPTASTRTRRTTPICSTSPPATSSRSTPRPRTRPSTRLRRRTRARGAAASIAKAACGLANIRATPSACSIRRPNASRSGRCRRRGARPTTPCSTATARRGPAPC